MKKRIEYSIVLSLAVLLSVKASAQSFFPLLHDSNSVKKQCYLMVGIDQLQEGLEMSTLKYDSLSISKSRIIPLKSHGLSFDLMFFTFKVITTHNDTVSYVFCYNDDYKVFYKVSGFLNSDYFNFFTYLKNTGVKLNRSYLEKEKISVEGIDILCLLDFYNTKKNRANKLITDEDRLRFKCLHHFFSPIVIP